MPMMAVRRLGVMLGSSCGIMTREVIGRNIKVPRTSAATIATAGVEVLTIRNALPVMIRPEIMITGFRLVYFLESAIASSVPMMPPMPLRALRDDALMTASSVRGNSCSRVR